MGVRSFLLYVEPGERERVVAALRDDPACEVFPASNRDVLVVVSDHDGRASERAFDEQLTQIEGVTSIALVSGYQV